MCRKLIPVENISEKFNSYPFLDAPKGYWNQSEDGYNGFSQVCIKDMTEKHRENSINLLNKIYIPRCNDDDILELLKQKIEELQEH